VDQAAELCSKKKSQGKHTPQKNTRPKNTHHTYTPKYSSEISQKTNAPKKHTQKTDTPKKTHTPQTKTKKTHIPWTHNNTIVL